ncbi:YbfB/YjiJ family MFS transporter, partial [Acinetobacter baumannii]
FSPSDVVYLGAANLAGYLGGALAARTVAGRIGAVPALRAMMLFRTVASGIPHHAVVDPAVSQRDDVERVILVQAPGPL